MDANALAAFVFVLILLLSVLGAHWIHTKHIKYATEGSLALLLGFGVTGLACGMYYAMYKQPLPASWLRFNDTLIFEVLLPPIIFYAGFSLKKKLFFQNFATIFTYGFLGTLAATAMVSTIAAAGLQLVGMGGQDSTTALAIGTIASCSDTVGILQVVDRRQHPVLYSLVFGEGIMNDAVAIVLLGAVAQLAKQQAAASAPPKWLPGAAATPPAAATPAADRQQGRSSMLAAPHNPVRPARPLLWAGASLFWPSASTPATHNSSSRSSQAASPPSAFKVHHPLGHVYLGGSNKLIDSASHSSKDTGWVTLGDGLQLMGAFLWLGLTSAALGVAAGLGSALLMKRVFKHSRHDCDREALLLGLMGLLAYMAAAAAELSAVLAVFFAGLTMSHYTWHSMSPAGRSLSLHSLRVVSGLMELVLYAYSGADMWTIVLLQQERTWASSLGRASALALVLLVAIIMVRLAFVLPASAAANVFWRRLNTLSPSDIAVVAWAGLSRGAITLALGYHYFLTTAEGGAGGPAALPSADTQVILLALVLLVLISTAVLGGATGPVIDVLLGKSKKHSPQEQAALQRGLEPDTDPLQLQDELANSELPLATPPPPAAAAAAVALSAAAAAAAEAAEERVGLNESARSRLRGWLKAASSQGLTAPLLHHTWSTVSMGSSQQDLGSATAAAGSTGGPQALSSSASVGGSEGPSRAALPHPAPTATATAAAAAEGGSVRSGRLSDRATADEALPPPTATASAAAAAAASGEEEARWSVPLAAQLQHTDSSGTLSAPTRLRWLSERGYSMNGEPVPLLPPSALEEISAWLSQLSQPGTGASSMTGTAVLAPTGPASAPGMAIGSGGDGGGGEVVVQERGGLHRLWQHVDRRWLQPWFGGRHVHQAAGHHHAS